MRDGLSIATSGHERGTEHEDDGEQKE